MLEKPHNYKKRVSKRRGAFDHTWPKKRSLNIEKMIANMRKSKQYLFEVAAMLLNNFSDIPWKLGDENMSLLIAWVAAQMDNECRAIKYRPKKVPRPKR